MDSHRSDEFSQDRWYVSAVIRYFSALSFSALSLLVFGLAFAPVRAGAAPVAGPHTHLELISETQSVQPGKPASVGFEFQLDEGWHIYWVNAGDSGQAPQVQWTLPRGVTAGEIAWPAPQRLPAPPLVNYGYENHVLLAVPLKGTESLKAGQDLHLTASVRWLVCRELCVPGKAKVELTLPVKDETPRQNSETSPLFDEAGAALPRPAPAAWKTQVEAHGNDWVLRVSGDPHLKKIAKKSIFFPLDPDQVENSVPQNPRELPDGVEFSLKRSEQLTQALSHLRGVLVVNNGGAPAAFALDAPVHVEAGPVKAGTPAAPQPAPQATSKNLGLMLVFAFLGGLILNLMPCVFPVLSIKILGFVSTPRNEKARLPWQGLAYTAGILVSFWVLAGTLIALRAGGQRLGWGFQLQSPGFIAVLSVFLFAFALNLAGVFEFGSSFSNVGSGLAQKEGLSGSFFTGVLATVVATPCTAPFMGSAVGFALSQGALVAMLVFTMVGAGLALPYLILSIEPSLGGVLPKPGRWMETLKELVSFPVFATVLWLTWVFGMQVGMDGLFRLFGGLLLVGLAAWVAGRWFGSGLARSIAALIVAAALAVSLSGAHVSAEAPVEVSSSAAQEGLEWEKFSREKIDSYRAAGRPVFLDFTAAWCVSCKVNELLVFRSSEVRSELRRRNFVLMKADWTTYDPAITQTLADFGRSGVPLYVIYPADRGRNPVVLPEIINAGIVLQSLKDLP